jgi:hypothetical protein
MSMDAPRYWTCAIPVAQTNYYRIAGSVTQGSSTLPNSQAPISASVIAGASSGNLPGLLVQDNINQPQFIFLDADLKPTCRITQKYEEWSITFTDGDNVIVVPDGDKREYVPIGNVMAFVDGILYIASKDGNLIYRSVSGRPLDFVIAIPNNLADDPFIQVGVGDASQTAYSVGVGGITCLRALPDSSLFVAASNANFSVWKDKSNIAPKLFGEYTLGRTFLFNANCLSDRGIIDTIGDTRFIELYGIRSFNAVQQIQNEGRNSPFSAIIQSAFGSDKNPIIQETLFSAAILFNNYELYAVNTIFGPSIAVYDTLIQCWSSFDTKQVNGKKIKIFSKIELAVQVLFAVTEDDKVYRLYVGSSPTIGSVRTVGMCANILYGNENIKMADPKNEIVPRNLRIILNGITRDCSILMSMFVNNRMSIPTKTKSIKYKLPTILSTDPLKLPDEDTMLENVLFGVPDVKQGWKVYAKLQWTNGSITQLSLEASDIAPMNPLNSQ